MPTPQLNDELTGLLQKFQLAFAESISAPPERGNNNRLVDVFNEIFQHELSTQGNNVLSYSLPPAFWNELTKTMAFATSGSPPYDFSSSRYDSINPDKITPSDLSAVYTLKSQELFSDALAEFLSKRKIVPNVMRLAKSNKDRPDAEAILQKDKLFSTTVLGSAAINNHKEKTRALSLLCGPDWYLGVNASTPLACAVGNPEIVALLLAFGANPNLYTNGPAGSPLSLAAYHNEKECLLRLVEGGAKLHHELLDEESRFIASSLKPKHFDNYAKNSLAHEYQPSQIASDICSVQWMVEHNKLPADYANYMVSYIEKLFEQVDAPSDIFLPSGLLAQHIPKESEPIIASFFERAIEKNQLPTVSLLALLTGVPSDSNLLQLAVDAANNSVGQSFEPDSNNQSFINALSKSKSKVSQLLTTTANIHPSIQSLELLAAFQFDLIGFDIKPEIIKQSPILSNSIQTRIRTIFQNISTDLSKDPTAVVKLDKAIIALNSMDRAGIDVSDTIGELLKVQLPDPPTDASTLSSLFSSRNTAVSYAMNDMYRRAISKNDTSFVKLFSLHWNPYNHTVEAGTNPIFTALTVHGVNTETQEIVLSGFYEHMDIAHIANDYYDQLDLAHAGNSKLDRNKLPLFYNLAANSKEDFFLEHTPPKKETTILDLVAINENAKWIQTLVFTTDKVPSFNNEAANILKDSNITTDLAEGFLFTAIDNETSVEIRARAVNGLMLLAKSNLLSDEQYDHLSGLIEPLSVNTPTHKDVQKRIIYTPEFSSILPTKTANGSSDFNPLTRAVYQNSMHQTLFWSKVVGFDWEDSQGNHPYLLALGNQQFELADALVNPAFNAESFKSCLLDKKFTNEILDIAISNPTTYAQNTAKLISLGLDFTDRIDDPSLDSLFTSAKEGSLLWELKSLMLKNADIPSGYTRRMPDNFITVPEATNYLSEFGANKFWSIAPFIDWSSDISALEATLVAQKATGVLSFSQFKSAKARDDVDRAVNILDTSSNLLAALAKNNLVDQEIVGSIGLGHGKIMEAFVRNDWPVSSSLIKEQQKVWRTISQTGDMGLAKSLSRSLAEFDPLTESAQVEILQQATKSGGLDFCQYLYGVYNNFLPSSIAKCLEKTQNSSIATGYISMLMNSLERLPELHVNYQKGQGSDSLKAITHLTSFQAEQWRVSLNVLCQQWDLLNKGQKSFICSALTQLPAKQQTDALLRKEIYSFISSDVEILNKTIPNVSDSSVKAKLVGQAYMQFAFSTDISNLSELVKNTPPKSLDPIIAAIHLRNTDFLRQTIPALPAEQQQQLLTTLLGHPAQLALDVQTIELLFTLGAKTQHGENALTLEKIKDSLSKNELFTTRFTGNEFHNSQNKDNDFPDKILSFESGTCSLLADLLAGKTNVSSVGLNTRAIHKIYTSSEEKEVAEYSLADATSSQQASLVNHQLLTAYMVLTKRIASTDDFKERILQSFPSLIEYVHNDIKSNPDLARIAVQSNGLYLELLPAKTRADLAICTTAVSQNTAALIHVPLAFRQDLNLTEANAKEELEKAIELRKSMNPLKMFRRQAVQRAEERALSDAISEDNLSRKSLGINFTQLEAALVKAKLNPDMAQSIEKVVQIARDIASDSAPTLSTFDKTDFARIIEQNIPKLLTKYAEIPESDRNTKDDLDRATPNQTLLESFTHAAKLLNAIKLRTTENAKVRLKAENDVLSYKADRTQGAVDSMLVATESYAHQIEGLNTQILDTPASDTSLTPRQVKQKI